MSCGTMDRVEHVFWSWTNEKFLRRTCGTVRSDRHSQENVADVVYTNGKIYTVNEAQPWVEVVSGNYSKH